MPKRIKLLTENIWTKIAAGEVVERPASVVKELIENSIDAGATDITVHIKDGGRHLIKVADNGEGILTSDAHLSLERHATSKIAALDDLSNITTLGFRGEALSAISSVSKTILRTRPKNASIGVKVTRGGSDAVVEDEGCPEGTIVEVRDLFYNTPARKKFLRSPQTEFSRIMDVVKKFALMHADIRFRVFNNASVAMDVKSGGIKQRVFDIYGRDGSDELLDVASAECMGVSVSGLVSKPTVSHPTSKYLFTYVNNRPVSDRGVTRAIIDGFSGTIERSRYPFSILNIKMPTASVDVNVHPAKSEVRFKDPSFVYDIVREAVKAAVAKAGVQAFGSDTAYGVREQSPGIVAESGAFYETKTHGITGGVYEKRKEDIYKENAFTIDEEIIGQLWGEFLVVEKAGEFWLIDQHAASERVRFESLKKSYSSGSIEAQYLLIPERFEVTFEEGALLNARTSEFSRFGFELAPFGRGRRGEVFLIKTVPKILSGRGNSSLIKDMLEELTFTGTSVKLAERIDSILMRIACHSVIRGARALEKDEAGTILKDLKGVDFSLNCPHGRPVVIKFSRRQIDAMFKRS